MKKGTDLFSENRCDLDFHAPVKSVQYRYQAVNGKSPEIRISDP